MKTNKTWRNTNWKHDTHANIQCVIRRANTEDDTIRKRFSGYALLLLLRF